MKIDNINNLEDYPENYDDWDPNKLQNATDYMNAVQASLETYRQKHEEAEGKDEEEHLQYLTLIQHCLTSLQGSKNAYVTLGIMMEYNWPGHEYEWFPAIRDDARLFEEWQEGEGGNTPPEGEDEEPVQPDDLLDYGDVM